jgi:cytochrome c553
MTRRTRVIVLLAAAVLVALVAIILAARLVMPPAAREARPALAEDLRPVYATVADIAEGRRVAEGTCARCHGLVGVSSTTGVPHLAGQRPAYLYAKLRDYQAGRRGGHNMESAVKFLSDEALVKVSAYYASLEPAQPAAAPEKAASADDDPLAAGKAAAAACAGCHGETGVTSIPGMPNLVGFDPKYFISAMNAYKTGQRRDDAMQALAAPLDEDALKALALYYALQKPERARTPVPGGDAGAGKAAAAACAGCHGELGVSTNPANPSLAGQDAKYFTAAMLAYKSGTRKEETMRLAVSDLSEAAIADMAAFYAEQEPKPPKVQKPLTLADWVQRCDRCHGVNGNSMDLRTPAIAAQRVDYLQGAVRAYREGERRGSVMAAMAQGLSESDAERLADYYSRQRARAVLYMPVPAQEK